MVASNEALERVTEERPTLELGVDLDAEVEQLRTEQHWVDGEIDVARFEAVREALRRRDDGEIDAWGLRGESSMECGQDERIEQVG